MAKKEKKTVFDPPWYEYRLNKGYFYGPGAGKALEGKPVVFWPQEEPASQEPTNGLRS